MCGRLTLTSDKDDLQSRFGYVNPSRDLFTPRYNIAPSQNCPVVTVNEDKRVLIMMRWGLVPFWAKDVKSGYNLINAKAETLKEKASFRTPFKKKRCLVLADGFYEWTHSEKKGAKQPYRFVLKNREPFAFAGLWDEWNNPDGEKLLTFTIITTSANELMGPIHDRMPVILHEKDEGMWLDPQLSDTDKLSTLLNPYPSDEMEAYKVSTFANSPKNESPKCIEPIGD